jgi:hypothetical protein
MIRSLRESHSVPVFEGDRSRGHRDVPVWKLAVEGGVGALRNRQALGSAEVFVQFIGFPRSGHSLIGSILDAHPRAVISHELDAMGLFEKGLPARAIGALILRNSAAFSAHGRWWNGFSYAVPGQPNGRAEKLRVLGDKKGDWAVRWFQQAPELLETVRRRTGGTCAWVLVTRHPLDNIATMSLRKNRTYDKLRIAAEDSAAFRAQLAVAQEAGAVASAARDDMIDDYEGLCVGIERMQTAIPEAERLHVVYERFVKDPAGEIRDLCRFLDLDPDEAYVAAAASIVRDSPNQSRNAVSWTDAQRARVARLIDRFAFLAPYEDDAGAV